MNWEDFPPLSTQPIGVQSDGAVVKLYPPAVSTRTVAPPLNSPMWNLNPPPLDVSGQLQTIAASTATVSMGAGVTVTANEILSHEGPVIFVPFQNDAGAVMIESDGTTTEAPDDGTAYPLTVG